VEALKVELAEKERLALLPAPALGFAITGQTLRITGTLADQAARDSLLKAVAAKYPGLRLEDLTTLAPSVKPGSDWTKALADAPKPGNSPIIFALGSPDAKPIIWDGKATSEDFAKTLASAGAAAVPSQPLFSALDLFNKQTAEAAAAAKAKADAEAKAKADAAAKAKAEADAKAKAMTPPTPLPSPAAPAARTPGYVGYALAGNTVRLFGVVGNDAQKAELLKSAATAFPGLQVDSSGIRIEASRAAPSTTFPTGIDLKTPTISFLNASGAPTTFKTDAFDSEIVKGLPASGIQESDLATALVGFRSDLVKAGSLKLDDPFLSLASDGKTLTVVGEIADAAARQTFLDGLKASATGLTIDDRQFTVSPLVTKGGDITATLKSLPKFEPGKPQIVSARPGQTARAGVVHGIYFGTGSDRSKDQERALFQVRRLLSINPASKFEIVGHTDNVGKPEANTKLSQDRAKKFAAYLEAAGVPTAQVSTRGAGPNEPIADNATDAGRAMNRRVDVLLK
jgi:OOP family OmpA-OmpF porin